MAICIRRPKSEISGPWAARMFGDDWGVFWEGPDDIQPGTASIRDVKTGEILSEFHGPNLCQARACVKFGVWHDLQSWAGQFGIPEDGAVTYQVAAE